MSGAFIGVLNFTGLYNDDITISQNINTKLVKYIDSDVNEHRYILHGTLTRRKYGV